VINKAYRAFLTCNGTFGKIWGLKPKVLHWIYIMIIRPILTYGSVVWWTRVDSISRMELNELQRLACMAIMVAMKTTPTAANGGPPGTSASTCDNRGGSPGRDLDLLTMVMLKGLRIWSKNPFL
jgi:hypothetical protein